MIGRIIAASIRHRVAVVLATLALAAWGAYSIRVAPIDAIPDLSENQVIAYAEWPGHGPGEVEDQVSAPLRLELNGIPGVKAVRSSSDFGASTLWVILEDSADPTEVRRALAERLANMDAIDRLPAGVRPRLAPDGPATGQIFWYTVEGGALDLGRLRAVQDWYVKPQLAAVPGVAEVASVGGMAAELQVEADPTRLRAHGVALPDLVAAVAASNGSSSGGVLHRSNAEFVVRGVNWIGLREGGFRVEDALDDLGRVVVPTIDGRNVLLADVATPAFGPQPRRGALEKDGVEATGGVVLMARGANPLAVTEGLKARIRELAAGLPQGVRIIPMYDRTPLIRGAVDTVSGTIVEAMVSATLCIILILRQARAALIIALTLPLSVLGSFGALEALRLLGWADVQENAMSLAGLAISIGVLVDSAIVMTENVLHARSRGPAGRPDDGRDLPVVEAACRQVGRPIVFAILIILLSFLPVFALGGLEGRMFRPLAATKTLAMAASGLLAITFVPALCSILLGGRARPETDSPIVRGVIEVYRPVLDYLLDRPAPLFWTLGATFLAAAAAVGSRPPFLAVLAVSLAAVGLGARSGAGKSLGMASLAAVGLIAQGTMEPLGREFLAPLDEGTVMDMPISIPRVPISQGVDDLKARDMVLCRFPEVAMVVGKLGRAETPTDPAPLDMIETMVDFHPREFWPARSLASGAAERQVEAVARVMERKGLIARVDAGKLAEAAASTRLLFEVQMREYAYQRNRELFRSPDFDEARWRLDGLSPGALGRWREHVRAVDAQLLERAPGLFNRIAIEELIAVGEPADPRLGRYVTDLKRLRAATTAAAHHVVAEPGRAMSRAAAMPPGLEPRPELDAVQEETTAPFARGLVLWRKTREDLLGFGGELDRAVPMPGWTNVWTMPIQNRVDMLATGVNTSVGIRVLGRDVAEVAEVSKRVAAAVKSIPGAADVFADPIRGKGLIEVRADRSRAERRGVSVGEINAVVEAALGGTVASTVVAGRERIPVRVRYARAFRDDEESVRGLLVRSLPPGVAGPPRLIPLDEVADVRVLDGPATIKGEGGMPRNYVRLNVRDRDVSEFVEEARRVVLDRVALPEGCFLEWTGQFEHELRARRTLGVVVPVVLALIFGLLYWTYRDLADATLMMLAVPGAIAGGIVCQWILGAKFSVTVWVGYIACFGMATSTGVIMLVYLRDALERAGGVESVDEEGLRRAVLDGAVHRLRPKLLTEATLVLGLAPMLWAGGVGGEVIRPMAAPVLGGILVADEVIDLFLPLLFYHVRRRRLRRLAPPAARFAAEPAAL
ncbi:efflux RND transporter permease subunit [Paludisphaera soli]|uniref:efflux RND transporter permease subunit n=1 Tax=Paludisphaera soli TaxID=2712865 RepID=UPI0013EDF7E3|nr:efflux RND transporter permease subunit [Paludisphaera soli]